MALTDCYKPPILDSKEAEDWDRFSIGQKHIEARLLMGWAGYSVYADLIRRPWFRNIKEIHLLAGPGNNGGDGYVVLWHILSVFSVKAFVWQLKPPKTEDAVYYKNLCESLQQTRNIRFSSLEEFFLPENGKESLVIDALFGTGLSKPPSEVLLKLFEKVNNTKSRKIAIDIPSGVYGNGDIFSHIAFQADITYTFGSYKIGHLIEPGIVYCGETLVSPIGFYPVEHPNRRLLEKLKLPALRKANGHKYTSGILTVLGGSSSMEGAALMSARSFLALGGGLARIVSTSANIHRGLKESPELMLTSVKNVQEAEEAFLSLTAKPAEQTAIIGVGLAEALSKDFWEKISKLSYLHLIIDGSALNSLSPYKNILQKNELASLTLTPHKGEAGKLVEKEITNIRCCAQEISKQYNAGVYLKGPGGILVFNDQEEIYIQSAHRELATGGTGDVLTGVLANCILRNGARAGVEVGVSVYLEAAAAISRKYQNETSRDFLTPSELIESLRKEMEKNYEILQ